MYEPGSERQYDPLDGLGEPSEEDLLGMDDWLENGDVDFDGEDDLPGEMVIRVNDIVDGSTDLQEVSERLYDYADELLSLAGSGWDLIEVMSNGQGVAIMLDDEKSDDDG